MFILDFITRLIVLPGCLVLVAFFIPEAIKDIKQWKTELFPERKVKQKTALTCAGATAKRKSSFVVPTI